MKIKNLFNVISCILLLVLWLFIWYFPPMGMSGYPKVFMLLMLVCLLILSVGFAAHILAACWTYSIKSDKKIELRKAKLEDKFRRFSLTEQLKDAENRRQHDLQLSRNKILVDLLEASKTKTEDVKEPVFHNEENTPKTKKESFKETHTEQKANIEALLAAIEEYKKLITQPCTNSNLHSNNTPR